MTFISKGDLRADKVLYPDGIGCCIVRPFPGEEGMTGIGFDFTYEEIDDLIALLQELKTIEAEIYVEAENTT